MPAGSRAFRLRLGELFEHPKVSPPALGGDRGGGRQYHDSCFWPALGERLPGLPRQPGAQPQLEIVAYLNAIVKLEMRSEALDCAQLSAAFSPASLLAGLLDFAIREFISVRPGGGISREQAARTPKLRS